ncbi:saccharopine dehydrogenase NADP-binding domain-containing protein [Enterococcus sp. N249-2]
MKNIAVIGGHGQVGQVIVKGLIEKGYTIVLMGRNQGKMDAFAHTFTPILATRQLDLTKEIAPEQLAAIDMVIVCLDQSNTKFVSTCQALGIDYLDISANSDFLQAVAQLPAPETSRRLIGLGLAPGITNVAAATYASQHPEVKDIDIDILLGLGDKHGEAAVKWTFAQLNRTYQHPKWSEKTENFLYGKKSSFGQSLGQLRSYNFDFADQHMLQRNDSSRTYTTYLGFDQNSVTALLAWIKKAGMAGVFKQRAIMAMLIWVMQKGFFGSQRFVVKISDGGKDDPHQIVLFGEEEANMTAEVAVFAVNKLIEDQFSAGAYQLPDITTLPELVTLPRLSQVK